MTTTLFKIIQSELIKKGLNEFADTEGNLIFYDDQHQFMGKIMLYDEDVSQVVDELFTGVALDHPEFDTHFKKGFVTRFANRRISRQTKEAFRMVLLSTFLSHKRYLNSVYGELETFILGTQKTEQGSEAENKQTGDSVNLTDNRSAFSALPQNNVQLDVDSTVMETANDNTISRNKQVNEQNSVNTTTGRNTSESTGYRLDDLLKSNGLEERLYDEFDRKCFMQTW